MSRSTHAAAIDLLVQHAMKPGIKDPLHLLDAAATLASAPDPIEVRDDTPDSVREQLADLSELELSCRQLAEQWAEGRTLDQRADQIDKLTYGIQELIWREQQDEPEHQVDESTL